MKHTGFASERLPLLLQKIVASATKAGILCCLSLACLYSLPVHARIQQSGTLNGIVTDAENGTPIEGAVVSLLQDGQLTDYALSDVRGRYSLRWKADGSRQLSVSILGYKRQTRLVSAPGRHNFALTAEAIALKEVEIRPGRIASRRDTVRYDLSQFASSRDVHIKDVLKRLPGVEVEESGKVRYKGKPIDHFLVEGMDVTGGRYNQVNNNLNAKAVKTAEIMENYQSVKALKDKINSEEVALNLKLDPQARDQWIVNGTLGMGGSDASGGDNRKGHSKKLLWEGAANALQLGSGRQSLYNYKTNNNGRDLTTEQTLLTDRNRADIHIPAFLSQPGDDAPLHKRRTLFNETHTFNGNRMYRWNDERSLRLQAGYTHHLIHRERSSLLTYYQPEDTLRVDESYHYRLRSDAAYAEMQYEDNHPEHYANNRFRIEGETERGVSQELRQKISTARLTANNSFHWLRNRETCTWEINSTAQYALLPSSLQVASEEERYRQQSLYATHSASYLRKHNGWTQRYKAEVQGEWSKPSASSLSLHLSPHLQWERGKWLGSLSAPIAYKRYFARKGGYFLYAPSLYLRCRVDYHWLFSLFGSVNRSAGRNTLLYPYIYRTDYRTWRTTNGLLPVRLDQNYQLYGEYKNTVQEFFITLSVNYGRAGANVLYEQSVSQDSILYTLHRCPNRTESWSLNSTLSKGIYDWSLKTSLNLSCNRSTGRQMTNGQLQDYRYDYVKAEPKIIWSPAESFEAEYQATISYGGSKIGKDTRLAPLLEVAQRLRLTFGMKHVDFRLSGEHYRNDLGNGVHPHTVFVDVSFIYKVKRWRMEASLNNLFNKKEYAYTIYSTTQSYTSRLGIRPREAMAKISYQF